MIEIQKSPFLENKMEFKPNWPISIEKAYSLLTQNFLLEKGNPASQKKDDMGIRLNQEWLLKKETLNKYFKRLIEIAMPLGFIGSSEDMEELWQRHIYDSLLPITNKGFYSQLNSTIVDLGSGAGLPGLALSILFSNLKFILIEQSQKRMEFLKTTKDVLGLNNVEILGLDINEAKQKLLPQIKKTFIYRAFRKPLASLEITAKLSSMGDKIVYWRSLDFLSLLEPSIKERAEKRIEDLGFVCLPNISLEIEEDYRQKMNQRILMIFECVASPKKGFARSWKKIKEDPLVESAI